MEVSKKKVESSGQELIGDFDFTDGIAGALD